MVKLARLLSVVIVLVAGTTMAATAAPPAHFQFPVNGVFFVRLSSATCGIPVYADVDGLVDVALFYDADGNVTREIDTLQNFTVTIFSPVDRGGTGKSFTFSESAMTIFDYGDGASIGSPVVITINGVREFAAPGLPVAVHVVATGVVGAFDPNGIPLVHFPTSTISFAGRSFTSEEGFAARCAALTDR